MLIFVLISKLLFLPCIKGSRLSPRGCSTCPPPLLQTYPPEKLQSHMPKVKKQVPDGEFEAALSSGQKLTELLQVSKRMSSLKKSDVFRVKQQVQMAKEPGC